MSNVTLCIWVYCILLICCVQCHDDAHKIRHKKQHHHTKECEEREEDMIRLKEIQSRLSDSTGCRCGGVIHAPVCGSDGITYFNRCYLQCASNQKYHRFHHKITVQKWGPCDEILHTVHGINSGIVNNLNNISFWERECPYINKRDSCTPPIKSFCIADIPRVMLPSKS